ncbi:MAG: hypothetical protein WA966_14245, partial [Ornithinimicrobium sp.]
LEEDPATTASINRIDDAAGVGSLLIAPLINVPATTHQGDVGWTALTAPVTSRCGPVVPREDPWVT